ncbi:MAG: M20/M25/M40 family metallo-hydrolase [Flavobacteriales bacterium]|nr:M20/M25/M40 family metallo-hydrolase [Flavobacteriales bacterium]
MARILSLTALLEDMIKFEQIVFAIALLAFSCSQPEVRVYGLEEMKRDLEYLASDELEGRETGTQGEALAAQYISEAFKELRLMPMGSEGSYFQEFEFKDKATVSEDNYLMIDEVELFSEDDYYPTSYSGNAKVEGSIIDIGYGIHAPDLDYDDLEGKDDLEDKIVLFNISSPDGIHPHSKYIDHHDISRRLDMLNKIKVKAVLMYNEDENADEPRKRISAKIKPYDFPVLFLTEKPKGKHVKSSIEISRPSKTGKNVVAFLNKEAENTVVIGAHYDHLGYGDEGSLFRGEGRQVHNGADDNASGVVCLFELAEELSKVPSANNYIFVAFSGEEKGLLGSNYFVKDMPLAKEKVNYMLNMDMVGRLEEGANKISINGVGTSPSLAIVDSLTVEGLSAQTTDSGIGASDHTSFYLEGIPAIHFFSGSHEDYHKPSDDIEKINYKGMERIVSYMLQLIEELDDDGKLEFTKTKDDNNRDAPNFKVTLGVIPDYLFDGEGMRIDGITEGRPAHGGNLIKGDIVIKMGPYEIRDMMSYMKALSKFQEGQKTEVTVLRGEDEFTTEITFD